MSAAVFADTSALYALLVAEDREHPRARAILASLQTQLAVLVSSSFVVQETVALLQTRIGVSAVRRFEDRVFPALEVEWVGDAVYERAMASLLAASRREVSLTDWTSFEVMRTRGIELAFAFDEHFTEQGFTLVSPAGG